MKLSLQINPANKPATVEQIYAKRNELEQAPITIDDGRSFNYEEIHQKRFEKTIKHFLLSPMVVEGKHPWVLADGTVEQLTLAELVAIDAELDEKLYVRGSILAVSEQTLIANPPNLSDLDNLATWGL